MKAVRLLPTDTCATYALRRIGQDDLIDKIDYRDVDEWVKKVFVCLDYSVGLQEMKPGDLLFWESQKLMRLPTEIDEKGKILFNNRQVKYHFGVVEEDGYWSDITRLTIEPIPIIQLRRLDDWTKGRPKYILKFRNE